MPTTSTSEPSTSSATASCSTTVAGLSVETDPCYGDGGIEALRSEDPRRDHAGQPIPLQCRSHCRAYRRLGRQQGRLSRRIRPRGHAADRRSPVAAAAQRSPGNQSATGDAPGSQGSRSDSSARGEPLRSNLEVAFPGALGLFSLDNPITLAFLRRFPTAAKASWLSPARLER